ncbi:DMT family transporter [Croceicoccus mobilis]|uniref:Membrane protein n=1 Tax=Croceicoccus mobilis TaxID=1703339 RepID=A0A916YYX1_9SPHN|nr:DMT family transporter [Croceicoccus mobilis]GGD67619.1 membrane protein [Croceicoccus mobilis]
MPQAPTPEDAEPAQASSGPQQRPMLALALRLGAAMSLATMFALVKLGYNRDIPLSHLMLVRQAASIPILLAWLAMTTGLGVMRTNRWGAHVMRSTYGIIGMVLNFLAPILLPLAVSTTLSFTAPVFAVILSALFLHEKVGRWRWMAVLLGFGGVVIVADTGGQSIPILGAAIAIGAAFMVAVVSIQIRDLARTENSIVIVLYFSLFTVPGLFIWSCFYGWSSDPMDYVVLLAIGVAGTLAQVLLTAALRFGQVATVIVMDYASLIAATAYGVWLFGNVPPASLWLGAPLIIVAGVIIVVREQVLHRRRIRNMEP